MRKPVSHKNDKPKKDPVLSLTIAALAVRNHHVQAIFADSVAHLPTAQQAALKTLFKVTQKTPYYGLSFVNNWYAYERAGVEKPTTEKLTEILGGMLFKAGIVKLIHPEGALLIDLVKLIGEQGAASHRRTIAALPPVDLNTSLLHAQHHEMLVRAEAAQIPGKVLEKASALIGEALKAASGLAFFVGTKIMPTFWLNGGESRILPSEQKLLYTNFERQLIPALSHHESINLDQLQHAISQSFEMQTPKQMADDVMRTLQQGLQNVITQIPESALVETAKQESVDQKLDLLLDDHKRLIQFRVAEKIRQEKQLAFQVHCDAFMETGNALVNILSFTGNSEAAKVVGKLVSFGGSVLSAAPLFAMGPFGIVAGIAKIVGGFFGLFMKSDTEIMNERFDRLEKQLQEGLTFLSKQIGQLAEITIKQFELLNKNMQVLNNSLLDMRHFIQQAFGVVIQLIQSNDDVYRQQFMQIRSVLSEGFGQLYQSRCDHLLYFRSIKAEKYDAAKLKFDLMNRSVASVTIPMDVIETLLQFGVVDAKKPLYLREQMDHGISLLSLPESSQLPCLVKLIAHDFSLKSQLVNADIFLMSVELFIDFQKTMGDHAQNMRVFAEFFQESAQALGIFVYYARAQLADHFKSVYQALSKILTHLNQGIEKNNAHHYAYSKQDLIAHHQLLATLPSLDHLMMDLFNELILLNIAFHVSFHDEDIALDANELKQIQVAISQAGGFEKIERLHQLFQMIQSFSDRVSFLLSHEAGLNYRRLAAVSDYFNVVWSTTSARCYFNPAFKNDALNLIVSHVLFELGLAHSIQEMRVKQSALSVDEKKLNRAKVFKTAIDCYEQSITECSHIASAINFSVSFYRMTEVGDQPCQQKMKEKIFLSYQRHVEKTRHPVALFHVANGYDLGNGVAQNDARAFEYYRESAKAGYLPALAKLGVCYRRGISVNLDEKKYLHYMRLAMLAGIAISDSASSDVTIEHAKNIPCLSHIIVSTDNISEYRKNAVKNNQRAKEAIDKNRFCEAVQCFYQAEIGGNVADSEDYSKSLCALGQQYQHGASNCSLDMNVAMACFLMSANRQGIRAFYLLGTLFSNRDFALKDDVLALGYHYLAFFSHQYPESLGEIRRLLGFPYVQQAQQPVQPPRFFQLSRLQDLNQLLSSAVSP